MKLTKRQLKRIIREEKAKIIREGFAHLETDDPKIIELRMKLLPIFQEAYIDQDMSSDDIMLAIDWALSYKNG